LTPLSADSGTHRSHVLTPCWSLPTFWKRKK